MDLSLCDDEPEPGIETGPSTDFRPRRPFSVLKPPPLVGEEGSDCGESTVISSKRCCWYLSSFFWSFVSSRFNRARYLAALACSTIWAFTLTLSPRSAVAACGLCQVSCGVRTGCTAFAGSTFLLSSDFPLLLCEDEWLLLQEDLEEALDREAASSLSVVLPLREGDSAACFFTLGLPLSGGGAGGDLLFAFFLPIAEEGKEMACTCVQPRPR